MQEIKQFAQPEAIQKITREILNIKY
jgi:hypothetical protein